MDLLINVDNTFLKVLHKTVFHYLTDECPDYKKVDQYSAKLHKRVNKFSLVITIAILRDKLKLKSSCIKRIFDLGIGIILCEEVLAGEVKRI
jgi:hypothetical protein